MNLNRIEIDRAEFATQSVGGDAQYNTAYGNTRSGVEITDDGGGVGVGPRGPRQERKGIPKMQLRYYQQLAINKAYQTLENSLDNPCIVLPTGSGKTPVIAQICKDIVTGANGRVLIVAHVKELLQQAADKLQTIAPEIKFGVYSAGLKRRDTQDQVIVAGVHSVYQRADELGKFDLMMIDEVHLLPESGEGMYRQLITGLLNTNQHMRIIGLTATPFRMDSGSICKPENILNKICYEISVKTLMAQGYLCNLVNKAAAAAINTDEIQIVRGEFDDKQAEQLFTADDEVRQAVREIVDRTSDRRSVLIFCQTISHAEQVVVELLKCTDGVDENDNDMPLSVASVFGHTSDDERAEIIRQFRDGSIKYLVNVGVLTTGFDAPNVDCVVMLRATVSPGLYYQCLGRGFRTAPGKENCLVLDFGQNIERHGPVDDLKPLSLQSKKPREKAGRKCERCGTVSAAAAKKCVDCGFEFPVAERELKHSKSASDASPVSGDVVEEWHDVLGVEYLVHRKKDAPDEAPKTMRVKYQVGFADYISEWICIEHQGWVRSKAESWWQTHCNFPCPDTSIEAVIIAEHGLLARAKRIHVRQKASSIFPEIIGRDLGPVPDCPIPCPDCERINTRMILHADHSDFPQVGKIVCGECGHFFRFATKPVCEHYGYFENENGILKNTQMLSSDWKFDRSGFIHGEEKKPEDQTIDDIPF